MARETTKAIIVPQLLEGYPGGRLSRWLKEPGDQVSAGEALFELETDLYFMEVSCRCFGFLTRVLAPVGSLVAVGETVALIGSEAPDLDPQVWPPPPRRPVA